MPVDERLPRRRVVAAGLTTVATGVAGCNGFQQSGGSAAPVVDNGADDPAETVTIELTIQDQNGEPVVGTSVRLEDRGGTPDDRHGTTGPLGRIRFLEGVGPPPCNTQHVVLPEYERFVSLGCNAGGSTVERTITVRQ